MNALMLIQTAYRLLGHVAPTAIARSARKLFMTPRRYAPRDWEREALATAEPVTFRFGVTGLRWGTGGPVILAMHGWEGRPSQFAHLVPRLLAAGRQVIAVAAPAHDRTPGKEAHPVAFAEALLEAAAELHDIEAVIGHSMGGSAAVLAVERGLPARRVVTLGSPAAMSRVLERFARWMRLPERARARFHEIVDRHVGIPAADLDVARIAGSLPQPALIVHDHDDDWIPFAEATVLQASWPSARLLETHGLGHRRVLTDPAVVDAVCRFVLDEPPLELAA